MRAVKSTKNLSTELKLIKLFKQLKITGWRRHQNLFGKPDFYFPKLRMAVFADGCFWHGCNCKKLKPVANRRYWETKIEKNKKRDQRVNAELKKRGYAVIRIRECIIKKGILPSNLLAFFKKPAPHE